MKLKSFTLVLALTLTLGCEEVLDTAPKGQFAEGTLDSESTVDKLVVAAYQGLTAHFFGNDQSFAGPANNWIIDVRSDDAYKGGGGVPDRSDIHQLETHTFDASNFAIAQKWRNPMFAIARTNFAIREIEKLTSISYPKTVRIGEMKFIRAHHHFDLLRNFRYIPYLDETTDPTTVTNMQYSLEELYGFLEADLQDAFDALPSTHDEIGRVTKYAAAALLCKVYMEQGKWSEAIAMADFVITGPFQLLENFSELSKLAYENGSETVFAVQYSTANTFANHDWSSLLNSTTGPGIDAGAYAAGDDFYHGSQNLVNAFKTDVDGLPAFDNFNTTGDVLTGSYSGNLDPRIDHSFGRLGIPWKYLDQANAALYDDGWVRSGDYYPGFSSKKQVVTPDEPQVHSSWPWAAAGLNWQVIRFAEVLLWKAEALIESGGDINEARDLINQIRQRVRDGEYVQNLTGTRDAANYQIGLYSASGWDQNKARQALRFERRLELAMEGHRYYDLLRWGIAAETINRYYAEESDNVVYLNGANYESGRHEYLPIPQGEIDLAPNLYQQNPAY